LTIITVFIISSPASAELTPLEGWDLPPAQKIAIFEKKLHETNDIDGVIMSDMLIHTKSDGSTYAEPAFGDSGYWTGNYLVGESLRYAITKDPEAKANCERSARALILMAHVAGKPGLLVRGYVDASYADRYMLAEGGFVKKSPDGKYFISLDVSADQLIGVMQGFHFVYRYVADEKLKRKSRQP